MTRTRWIGANWKMNPPPEGFALSSSAYRSTNKAEVVVFPACLDIPTCINAGITTGGQYGRAEHGGAFTGDISMKQLKAAGCTAVLCGHSERRLHHEESDVMVTSQVAAAMKEGLTAVLCIGETEDEYTLGQTKDVLCRQLQTVLAEVKGLITPKNFIVAYEPVWAIGTGKSAQPKDVAILHRYIRTLLPTGDFRIVYGGSVNGKNAAGFFAEDEIDGALVGGASLVPDGFATIVEAA